MVSAHNARGYGYPLVAYPAFASPKQAPSAPFNASFYALSQAQLQAAVRRMIACLRPGGAACIVQSARQGHYCRFHAKLCEAAASRGSRAELLPAASAEDVAEVLTRLGVAFTTAEVGYTTTIRADDRKGLEQYLQARNDPLCVTP